MDQQERSKLIQKQKQAQQELEKKIKKLKGAMKEAAQKELEELEKKHEAELAEFETAGGASGSSKKKEEKEEEGPTISAKDAAKFKDRNWNGYSKKELEEAASDRGLSKKGSKEDLIMRITLFQQELASKVAAAEAAAPAGGGYAAAKPPEAPKPKAADSDDEEEEEDSDEEEDDDSDDEEDDMPDVDEEELEKQGKREKAVQKAVKFLLNDKCPDGFGIDELCAKLEMVNVKGFAPEKLGYKNVEKFVRGQPESVLRYKKKEGKILPPKSR
eukprot:TRINITY_DN14958_c0_g3_i1.p1 TRINITY_DN14958_c0_g3~~TRINITY_DN14958_c0_g3_i1.p1  ORF type:complete len:272 (-),score=125.87 TRINITY_DN14958_c0_g3_i1:60-875(-)